MPGITEPARYSGLDASTSKYECIARSFCRVLAKAESNIASDNEIILFMIWAEGALTVDYIEAFCINLLQQQF
jgi:hypothetical protein